MSGVRVRLVPLEGGERLPFLIGCDGLPLFEPTAWLTTLRRSSGRAVNTLQADLYALKILYDWAARNSVAVEEVMLSGKFLSQSDIASLLADIRLPLKISSRQNSPIKGKATSIKNIESARVGSRSSSNILNWNSVASRTSVISNYLEWLAVKGVYALPIGQANERIQRMNLIRERFRYSMPLRRGRNRTGLREAPSQDTIFILLKNIHPESPKNPWVNDSIKYRNALIVNMLYALGVRGGELLGIKIQDHINFQNNTIFIARNADDPDEARRYPPSAKTRDRQIPVSDALMSMIIEYVTNHRFQIKSARKHQYLFVSHRSGAALSKSQLTKIFKDIRERVDDMPVDISAHMLRHAWNDAFSRIADVEKISPETEAQLRSEIMGWSPASGTAALYLRRKIKEDAKNISLKHQMKIGTPGR